MNRSENINELAAALAKAQGQMIAAKKDSTNPFFKSKYADLASIVEAIKKPLADNGLAYSQLVSSEARADGEAYFVETILMHASGQWQSERVKIVVAKPNDPQSFGSAVTYFRRYSLQAVTGTPADDDDANAAAGKPGAYRATSGAEEHVNHAQKVKVDGIVEAMRAHLDAGHPELAVNEYQQENLNIDEMVYLWQHFDPNSKERSAMTAAERAMKAPQKEKTLDEWAQRLELSKTMTELRSTWNNMPVAMRALLEGNKEKVKARITAVTPT